MDTSILGPERAEVEEGSIYIIVNLGDLWIDRGEVRQVVAYLLSIGHEDKAERMLRLFESMGLIEQRDDV